MHSSHLCTSLSAKKYSSFKWLLCPLLFTCVLLAGVSADAYQVTLAWSPSESASIAGYRLHYGSSSHNYPHSVNVGDCDKFVLSDLEPGQTYYFALTAFDFYGNESGYSNEVSFQVPINATPWINLLLLEK